MATGVPAALIKPIHVVQRLASAPAILFSAVTSRQNEGASQLHVVPRKHKPEIFTSQQRIGVAFFLGTSLNASVGGGLEIWKERLKERKANVFLIKSLLSVYCSLYTEIFCSYP